MHYAPKSKPRAAKQESEIGVFALITPWQGIDYMFSHLKVLGFIQNCKREKNH